MITQSRINFKYTKNFHNIMQNMEPLHKSSILLSKWQPREIKLNLTMLCGVLKVKKAITHWCIQLHIIALIPDQ